MGRFTVTIYDDQIADILSVYQVLAVITISVP